jgi:hypothetical protein
MATPFERFRAKWYLAWDAMQRIGPPDAITEETAARDQAYIEGQLGRVELNAKRAANYISEMDSPPEDGTDIEPPPDDFDVAGLVEKFLEANGFADDLIKKCPEGTNGKHDDEVKS